MFHLEKIFERAKTFSRMTLRRMAFSIMVTGRITLRRMTLGIMSHVKGRMTVDQIILGKMALSRKT